MNLGVVAAQVKRGETVTFTAHGNSMTPRIKSGDTVTVAPYSGQPQKGEVVLARVKGRWFLHLITAVKPGHVQISNNKGHVNGWTAISNLAGKLQTQKKEK